jgi:pSer/pThr/pTyr-binding forkhead associated (FHA) protein
VYVIACECVCESVCVWVWVQRLTQHTHTHTRQVSNRHCSLRCPVGARTVTIRDHSTNGTYVNGERIPREAQCALPHNAILSLVHGTSQAAITADQLRLRTRHTERECVCVCE